MMNDELSTKMRAYLAEIYRLSELNIAGTHYVGTSALADLLMVSAPAVNRMVNRLKELGLIEHEPYQGIFLTPAGTQEALIQLRHHRITEAFLVSVMGFTWDQVYHEAMNMSVGLSEPLIKRMEAMSGAPKYCPHGEPIPTADGTIEDMQDLRLSEAEAGTHAIITRVKTREADRLQYLEALGLEPEKTLEVYHVAPFSGPMQLKLNGEFRIIGHNLAELIRVRSIET